MLQRWKRIISNWNNCFIEDDKHEKHITKESVIHIICYLRQNFNLDQSKSSIVEARTVEEFINEKYPEFVFEHGTAAPADQDELYLVASLLLFFVCVNSKDTYLKHTMCSKLRTEDQEIILKFSKKLMECRVISCGDVKAAITEACGLEEATTDRRPSVAETPPVLRSLHSEVRRLQAALDAEQFDRNYLQEELTRTNARLEKLSKEKEQYKLEISNLKSQVSSRDEDRDSPRGSSGPAESRAASRVKTLEDRLDELAMQLHDLEAERDQYKSKLEDLKQDRDKWVTEWQHESARVAQLTEELETERQQGAGMRELLAELTEHNKLNRGDSSMVECDYLDTSVRSLPHNTSLCTEACANVVEVQLGEERARIVVLQQQIQLLQDQITELNKQYDDEKLLYQTTLSDRENTIFNLKHRINEEIEEKDKIKSFYDNEMTKLNNEINELEQSLKETSEHSHSVIETKMAEIQTLQEEKLSLIHSLNTETTKLDNVIKSLQNELDNEKLSKSKMKEGYENHLMKLNEKVLNRNNELVELQNSIFEKGEKIETLQIELRKVKEVKDELLNKYHELDEQKMAAEEMIREKTDQVNNLQTKLDENNNIIDELQTEVTGLKQTVSDLSDNCKLLEDTKQTALKNIEELRHDAETLKTMFTEQIDKLTIDLDEKNAHVTSLQTQLKGEITFKIELHNEVATLISIHEVEMGKFKQANDSINKYMKELQDKEKMIDGLDLYIKEVKRSFEVANKKITDLSARLEQKNDEIKTLEQQIEAMKLSFEQAAKLGDEAKIQLDNILLEKEVLLEKNKSLDGEVASKDRELIEIQDRLTELQQKYIEREKIVEYLDKTLTDESTKYKKLEASFLLRFNKLMLKFSDAENNLVAKAESIKGKLVDKDSKIQSLLSELDNLRKEYEVTKMNLNKLEKENEDNREKLNQDTEGQNKTKHYNKKIVKMNARVKMLNKTLKDKIDALKYLEDKLSQESQSKTAMSCQLKADIKKLTEKNNKLETANEELRQSLKKIVAKNNLAVIALQTENEQLKFTIEENNSSREMHIKEEDVVIDNLEKRVLQNAVEYKALVQTLDSLKQETEIILNENVENITKLSDVVSNHEKVIETMGVVNNSLKVRVAELGLCRVALTRQISEEISRREAIETDKEQTINVLVANKEALIRDIDLLTGEMAKEKFNIKVAEDEKNALLSEKIQIKALCNKKINEIGILQKDVDSLTQTLSEERSAKEDLLTQVDSLADNNTKIKTQLEDLERIKLEQCREIISMTQELDELHAKYEEKKKRVQNYEAALKEKDGELEKEKANHHYLMKENRVLESKNRDLKHKIEEVNVTLNQIIEEKTTLINKLLSETDELNTQLGIEKSNRLTADSENETLRQDFENLKEDNEELIDLLKNAAEAINKLEKEGDSATVELGKKEAFIQHLIEERDRLLNDYQVMEQTRNTLAANFELQARHSMDKEVNSLVEQLTESNEKVNRLNEYYSKIENDLRAKKEELLISNQELEHLKVYHCKSEEANREISEYLSKCFRIVDEMNEDWENDSLQNIVACENDTITNKCTSLIKLVEALTGEVVNIKSALKCEIETKERLKEEIMEKETEILELRTEVQTLEKTVDDTKIELSKQTESYTSSLNDLKALQQENQTLASELTTVKMQLEVKVHSLKEKLVDSELLTDKLKSSYDLQIDNLNLMVAKLTNFLKEKTIEVDGLKKEKEDLLASGDEKRGVIKTLEEVLKTERQNMDILLSDFELERQALKDKLSDSESVVEKLTTSHELEVQNFNLMLKKMSNSLKEKAVEIQTLQKQKEDLLTSVAESCKVIKSLENDMTTEKLNMDKMLADFESERQVLRNMVTVTESVMDDQKQTLNSIIEDYKKDIETLRDDNKALKETVNKLKSKLSGSEIANDSLSSLMKKERELKLFVEEESEILREYLDDAMKELCYEIGLSSNLKGDKDHLSVELEKCRNELQAILKCEESEKLQKIRENIELNNMIEQVNETLSAVMKEKDTLQAEKSKLVEENNEHESRIKENNIQFIMLRKENEELVAQNQQYSDNVKDINEKLYNLTKMTNELETQNRQSIDEVEKLKLEIDNLVKQKEKLEIEHVQLLIQNKHYTKEIEVAKRKIDDVIEEKDQLELEKNNLIEENTENVNKIAEVNEKLNNFLKKKEVLEADNRKRFEEIKEVKCKLDSLQAEKKQFKTEKEQLTDEKESLKQQKEQLELENSRLITENRENGQKIIEVTERLNNLIKDKDVFEVDRTKQIEEMKCKLDALQTEKKLLETEKEQLTKEKDVFELEKEQLVAQNREHASKTEEVYQKLNVLQKSEIESNKHYEDINKKMESLVQEKEELQIKIKQLISENKQYVAEIEGVREKMYELVKQKEIIDTEKVQLVAESKENANKIEEITEKFNALVKDKTDLELENKNNIAEIKAVAVRIDAILEEKLQLETEKSQLITENKELGSKVEEITQKLEHVLKSNYDLENENKQQILQVEVEKEHLETEKKQLAIENEEKMNKIKDLTEQLNDVVTVKMELETQNIKYVEEIEEIKCKIHILLTEKKELDAEKEHLVAEKQELVHKIDEITQTLDNVQKQKTEAEFENIKLNAEINEVKTKIDSLRDETEQLEIERNELLTQNKEQYNKIKEINEKITSVLEEKRHLEVDKIEFEAKINELIKLKSDNEQLTNAVEESKTVICQLEQLINQELQQKQTENEAEVGSSTFIQNEAMLRQKETQLTEVHRQIECMKERIDMFEKDCVEKDHIISKMSRDKDDIINKISKELVEERLLREKLEKELEVQKKVMGDVKTNLEMELLRKENERLVRAIGQHETLAAVCRQPAGGEQPSPAAIDQKELFNEQMAVMKSRQREEMLALEANARRAEDARRDAEQHIRELTRELWAVGEKYLVKNDEAEWLKRKHRSGSLMSLQHTHSAGLSLPQEPPSRPSDAQSLRSLPVTNKRERGLAVYEEDGEVFDNRWLKELNTPRRGAGAGAGGAERLSELRYRNSLCLPHLKSSYPAETQFVPAANEDDIKALGKQRKEVGITAYKKPGPPTPSKQAGRLSATDSELRESLRVENEPYPDRKTSTPARIRAFLSFKKNDTNDGTPRRRLSNLLFRKK